MSVRYHISPKTGNPNICRAKTPESCPVSQNTEGVVEHFESKADARKAFEKHMEEKSRAEAEAEKIRREKIREERKKAAEKNWPSPTDKAVEAYRNQGFVVDPTYKSLMNITRKQSDGYSATVQFMAGSAQASYGTDDHMFEQYMRFGDLEGSDKIVFQDYATRLEEDEAKKHLEKLENALKNSNKFVKDINQTASNAQMLYGHPEKRLEGRSYYTEAAPVDDTLNDDVKVLEVRTERDWFPDQVRHTYHGEHFNLYVEEEDNGDFNVEVNMRSMSKTDDVNDFKNRIYELRNILATVDELKK